ncbi:MAG: hypothetical protein FWG62_05220 [Proteobacteria bacterium]|nr:hypothetical protein [Pseudomonadota bacterium]
MKISQLSPHLAASILLAALCNTIFFRQVMAVYPLTLGNAGILPHWPHTISS